MRLALYQPDIPQNTGTLLRLAACLGVPVDLIGPAGFDWGDRALRRAGLDYLDKVEMRRHVGWSAFEATRVGRLVLLTVKAEMTHVDFVFSADDVLLLGRESSGVPAVIHAAVDARIRVPMQPGFRSLNVAVAGAMALGEALRQTGGYPRSPTPPQMD